MESFHARPAGEVFRVYPVPNFEVRTTFCAAVPPRTNIGGYGAARSVTAQVVYG
jgi:hypothetical protein